MYTPSTYDTNVSIKTKNVNMTNNTEDIVYRLRKRAEIRRQIPTRKSVLEGQPDRIADLLEEAAYTIERMRNLRPEIELIGSHSEEYEEGFWAGLRAYEKAAKLKEKNS
jgi:hypothetical protein